MKFRLDGGALLTLGEPKSPLEELELPMGELEFVDERLAISLTMKVFFFFSKRKKEMQGCKRNEE